jgi:hypothetical protein
VHVFHGANAAPDGERHEALIGGAFDHIDDRRAVVGAGGYVEEYHLVRALVIVAHGEFHGIADVAQTAFFSATELHAARHVAAVDIEARDDSFRKHRAWVNVVLLLSKAQIAAQTSRLQKSPPGLWPARHQP